MSLFNDICGKFLAKRKSKPEKVLRRKSDAYKGREGIG